MARNPDLGRQLLDSVPIDSRVVVEMLQVYRFLRMIDRDTPRRSTRTVKKRQQESRLSADSQTLVPSHLKVSAWLVGLFEQHAQRRPSIEQMHPSPRHLRGC